MLFQPLGDLHAGSFVEPQRERVTVEELLADPAQLLDLMSWRILSSL